MLHVLFVFADVNELFYKFRKKNSALLVLNHISRLVKCLWSIFPLFFHFFTNMTNASISFYYNNKVFVYRHGCPMKQGSSKCSRSPPCPLDSHQRIVFSRKWRCRWRWNNAPTLFAPTLLYAYNRNKPNMRNNHCDALKIELLAKVGCVCKLPFTLDILSHSFFESL